MKKTLVAVAVAASVMVSGSVMADGWTANGTGGSMDLGGTLTPDTSITPWVVKVGDTVDFGQTQVKKGVSSISLDVSESIPVLGIRTKTSDFFYGQSGISPQIDFNNAVDLDGFSDGTTTLTLDVKNAGGDSVGTMTAPFTAAAVGSIVGSASVGDRYGYVIASYSGRGFWGGIANEYEKSAQGNSRDYLTALSADFVANINDQGMTYEGSKGFSSDFTSEGVTYSAAYGAGIMAGKAITIDLNEPVSGDESIVWSVNLPVTVSYM